MASTIRKTRVVGNTGRKAFGSRKYKKKASHGRRNVGHIVGFSLAGNPGRKAGSMAAKTKKKKGSRSHHYKGYAKSRYKGKGNPGHKGGHSHHKKYRHKRHNPGLAGVGPVLTNATFVIIGGVLSRAGAQMILGSQNVGVFGYAANVAVGGVLWFIARNIMKSPTAASGIIAGTAVALIMRVINDYTPFGQYISQLGMGDYQMQSFVTPQVLVDPWHSAEIGGPGSVPAWGAPALPAAPPATGLVPAGSPMPASRGTGGLYGGGWGGGLYSA